jgi:hypothetical protein
MFDQPLFKNSDSKKWETQLLHLIASLEQIQTQQKQNFKEERETEVIRLVNEAETLFSKNYQRLIKSEPAASQSLQAYLALKHETVSFFPLSCERLGLDISSLRKAKPTMSDMLQRMNLLNQVITLATQLKDDLLLTNHKYMAHQMALLYQSLNVIGKPVAHYKQRIEKRFDQLKAMTNVPSSGDTSKGPVLNNEMKLWISDLCSDILRDAHAMNQSIAGEHVTSYGGLVASYAI